MLTGSTAMAVELAALREENARLRQRVEELERAPRCCADTIPPGCRTCRCADAAEAKLARCVEAGELLLDAYGEAHALYDLGECEGSLKMRAALAVAKGWE